MVEQDTNITDSIPQSYILTIARINQFYVVNPDIKAFDDNGIVNCSIPNGENTTLTLPANTYNLHFKGQGCKASVTVNLTQNTTIVLKYNRLLGGLEVYVNDVKQKQSSDKPKLPIGWVVGGIALVTAIIFLFASSLPTHSAPQVLSGTVVVDDGAGGAAFSLTKEAFSKAYNEDVVTIMRENGKEDLASFLAPFMLDDSKWIPQDTTGYDNIIIYEYSNPIFVILIAVSSTTDNIYNILLRTSISEVSLETMYPFFSVMLKTLDPRVDEVYGQIINDYLRGGGIITRGICGNASYEVGMDAGIGYLEMTAISNEMKARDIAGGVKEYFAQ